MEALEIEESMRLYYQQELERITNQQSHQSSEKNMPHIIAIGTLTATVLGLTAAFPPAAVAFGFLVLGAGLVARD